MQDMNAFNLQLQIHQCCFDILILKRWILIYEKKNKKKCQGPVLHYIGPLSTEEYK